MTYLSVTQLLIDPFMKCIEFLPCIRSCGPTVIIWSRFLSLNMVSVFTEYKMLAEFREKQDSFQLRLEELGI